MVSAWVYSCKKGQGQGCDKYEIDTKSRGYGVWYGCPSCLHREPANSATALADAKFAAPAPSPLSPSEALYGFAGWLTTRGERVVMSDKDDAAIVADLVDKFCEANQLAGPREGWSDSLVHPGEDEVSGPLLMVVRHNPDSNTWAVDEDSRHHLETADNSGVFELEVTAVRQLIQGGKMIQSLETQRGTAYRIGVGNRPGLNCDRIEEHSAAGEGDKWYYDVYLGQTTIRIFDPVEVVMLKDKE